MRSPRAAIAALPPRGYRWWYVDGLSDDGHRGFTAIYFVGSVFSPWMASRAWRGEAVPPTEHIGVHLALYENDRPIAWTMMECGAAHLRADDTSLHVERSSLVLSDDGAIEGALSTKSAPMFWSGLGIGRAIEGRFELGAGGRVPDTIELGRSATGAAHHWQIGTPSAPIEVEFTNPKFSFRGHGYHDGNWGDGRLEEAFTRWSWARSANGEHILYTVESRDGGVRGIAVDGERVHVSGGALGATTATGWGLHAPHEFTVEGAGRARVTRWLDRTPFYARYVAQLEGTQGSSIGIGEFLDLDRFQRGGVQFLLRWRAQRRK